MGAMRRRSLLAAAATAAGVGAGGCLSDDDSPDGELVLERTVTPEVAPVALALDAGPGAILNVELTYDEAAAAAVIHGATGVPLGYGGVDAPVTGRASESEPLPDATAPNALAVAAHEDDPVDVTVTTVGTGPPAAIESPGDRLTSALDAVGETGAGDEWAAAVVGPLWLAVFETALGQSQTVPASASAALEAAAADVYAALARQRAEAWASGQVETVAGALTSVATAAVTAQTGLPAFLVEEPLQNGIEDALGGGQVSWGYDEFDAGSLDTDGGTASVVATMTTDLQIQGTGLTLEAPLALDLDIDGGSVPASASVTGFEPQVDAVSVEVT